MDQRIIRAVCGDSEALGQLLFEHHDRLAAFIRREIPAELRSQFSAEDVLQEAYVDAFRNIGQLVPKSDRAFARWLRTIAEHRLTDRLRALRSKKRGGKRRRVQGLPGGERSTMAGLLELVSDGAMSPSGRAVQGEALRALQIHLSALPERHRQAVRLHHLDGLDLERVAAEMGENPDAVRGVLYRARKKLRDAMGRSSLWFLDRP